MSASSQTVLVNMVRKKKLSKSRKNRLRSAGATEENLKLIAQDYAYSPLEFDDLCVTWLQKNLILEIPVQAPKVPWKLSAPSTALDVPGVSDEELLGMFAVFNDASERPGLVTCEGLLASDLKDILAATRRMAEFVSKVTPMRQAPFVISSMVQSLVDSRKAKRADLKVKEEPKLAPGFLKFGQFPAFKYSMETETVEELALELEKIQNQETPHSKTLLSDNTDWKFGPIWVDDDDELCALRLALDAAQQRHSTTSLLSSMHGEWSFTEPGVNSTSVIEVDYWPITVESEDDFATWNSSPFKWLSSFSLPKPVYKPYVSQYDTKKKSSAYVHSSPGGTDEFASIYLHLVERNSSYV